MAKGYTLGAKAVQRMQELSAAERARVKNEGVGPAGGVPFYFAPALVRITETIDAREDDTLGIGDGELWLIQPSTASDAEEGEKTLQQNAAESTIAVINMGKSPVVASTGAPTYRLATQIRGGAYLLTLPLPPPLIAKSTGSITARSGTTPGTGYVRQLRLASGVLVETTGDTLSVYNLSATAIVTGRYLQLKPDDEGNMWVDFEDCST